MGEDRLSEAFGYIDSVIEQLEGFHVAGRQRVPRVFMPRVIAINDMVPDRARPPKEWNTLIRKTIAQCFEVQEALKALRISSRE